MNDNNNMVIINNTNNASNNNYDNTNINNKAPHAFHFVPSRVTHALISLTPFPLSRTCATHPFIPSLPPWLITSLDPLPPCSAPPASPGSLTLTRSGISPHKSRITIST